MSSQVSVSRLYTCGTEITLLKFTVYRFLYLCPSHSLTLGIKLDSVYFFSLLLLSLTSVSTTNNLSYSRSHPSTSRSGPLQVLLRGYFLKVSENYSTFPLYEGSVTHKTYWKIWVRRTPRRYEFRTVIIEGTNRTPCHRS